MNTIDLILGDWSHDGHGLTDTITITSNLTVDEVKKAYKDGANKVGVDLVKDACSGYEDPWIAYEDWQKLAGFGLTPDSIEKYAYDVNEMQKNIDIQHEVYLSRDAFVKAYLFIIGIGNPDFNCDIVKANPNTIHIGGYGLFCN